MGLRYFNSVPENNSLFTLIPSSALIVRVSTRKLTTFGSMLIKLNHNEAEYEVIKSINCGARQPDSI